MKHSVDNLKALDSRDVSYFLLCSIWTSYDYGGISMRRSLRAAVLENALDLLRMSNSERERHTPLYSRFPLLEEARKRKPEHTQGILFGATYAKHYDLAMVLIEKLLDICKENDKTKDFKGEDTTILEEIIRLTPPPFNQTRNALDDMQTEARDRIYEKQKRESELF